MCQKPPPPTKPAFSQNVYIRGRSFLRFLVIQGANKDISLTKLNPFAIEKGLKGLAGTPTSVKRFRPAYPQKTHSDWLLRFKMLANIPIKVVLHRSNNTKTGVMRCRDFAETSEENIKETLSVRGIMELRKIRVQRDGREVNTGTIILTFGIFVLSTSIEMGFLRVKDDVYIPSPLQYLNAKIMDATEYPVIESLPVPNVEQRVMGIRNVITVLTMTKILEEIFLPIK